MRRSSLKPWCLMLAGLMAGLALHAGPAAAQSTAGLQHQSALRIGAGELGVTRQVRLGLNKSMVVDLPDTVRDVMVSDPTKINAVMQTSTRAFIVGVKPGEANVFFIDKNGKQMLTLELSIERDLAALDELLARLIPNSHIHIDSINERAVLTGSVADAIDATRACEIVSSFLGPLDQQNANNVSGSGTAVSVNTSSGGNGSAPNSGSGGGSGTAACDPTNVINMLAVDSKEQVLLKVQVVEMERNIVKQFGIDLNTLVNSGNFSFATLSSLPYPVNGALGAVAPFLPNSALNQSAAFPANAAGANATTGLQWMTGNNRVQSVLRALEEDGLVHTLAEPNLTAISGETANFLAGGEFPIPVAQGGSGINNTAITVQFKQFGIGLAFTPVVMSEGRISLKISTEVSDLTNEGAVVTQGISIPALRVRRAGTTVELPSGGSLAMAGLLSDQSRQTLSGYPGIKNLPVLGALFRSRDFQKDETELVVIVTPYIAKAVPREQLAQPDDGFGWASDVHSDLLGQMNRVYGRNPERAPVGKFQGDVGYIVE